MPNRQDPHPHAASPRPVLVVDDSRAHRHLLARTLSKWGYATIEAESGEHALAICGAMPVDIVISDWMMPGMTGIEFCRAFREHSDGHPAYFILLTAQTEREALAQGLASGADEFLSKPFSTVELRARLQAGERIVNAQRDLSEKNQTLTTTLERLSDAYAAIDRDLRQARRFQEGLVPERHLPLGPVSVSMLFRPSGHIGGDLVGHFRVSDREIGIYSVDVSGHGVASALMTARIAGYLANAAPERNIALESVPGGYRMVPPAEICVRLNGILQADGDTDQYLTFSIARVEIETGTVEISQAGHPSPAIQRADGTVEFLELFSTPIGLVDDPEFASATLTLGPGDRLMMYSDGITECPDTGGNLLDEDGLATVLAGLSHMRGPDLVGAILAALGQHSGGEDFPDDLSALIVERH